MPLWNNEALEALKASTPADARFLLPESVKSRWNPDIQAANSDDAATINIYDVIGEDTWTGQGMTGKIVSGILRKNKGQDITVNINSGGGNFFEGLAIYNLLKEHDGEVTINVVGMAASAAGVIAMAGDNIKVAEAGFLMVHNAWNCVCGNKHVMREMADTLDTFDASMISLFSKKTGIDAKEITAMLDAETWIAGPDAVAQGFATGLLDSDAIEGGDKAEAKYSAALKEIDTAMAKGGKSRTERRALLKDLTAGTPSAAASKEPITPSANHQNHVGEAFSALHNTLSKYIN